MIKNIGKNFIWNAIGSTINACNSLFFMIIVTRINGVDDAGIFTFAFSLACMFYIIGIYSGRTYQVTESDNLITDSDYFYSKIITCFIMIIFSILYCIIKKYDFTKIIIILSLVVFKSLEAFSEVLYAIIQKNNKLYKVGKSLFFKSIISVIVFILIDRFTNNLLFSILSIIIINFTIIIFYDFNNCKKSNFKIEKLNKNHVIKILKNGFYAFAFAFLTQYVINSPRYAIDNFLDNKSQTIFGILIMPATIIILLGQFIMQPFLLTLKKYLKEEKSKFFKTTIFLSLIILLLGIIATVVAYFLGIPFLNLIYNINLNDYVLNLLIIIIGATLYGITTIISTSLTTMRSTLSQLIVFIIVSIFSGVMSNVLVKRFLILGATYSYLFTMILLIVLYIVAFIIIFKRYGGNDNGKSNCNIANL